MKKRIISVVLVMTMLMSMLCSGFVSSAAATDAQWNTLIAALKNDTVKNAQFTGSANSMETDDSDGSILAAAEAFYAVVNGTITANANQNSNLRTAQMVKDTIKNQLQSKMGTTDFNAYNVAGVVEGFMAGATVDATNNTESALTAPTVKFKVNMGPAAVLGYDSIADVPATIASYKEFTLEHKDATYSQGSGCNAKTYHYLTISRFSTTNGPDISTSVLTDANNYFASIADLFDKTTTELLTYTAEELSSYKTNVTTHYNAVVNTFNLAVYNKFFSDYDALNLISRLGDAESSYSYKIIADRLTAAITVDYSAYSLEEMTAHYNSIMADLNAYNNANATVKAIVADLGFDQAAVDAYEAELYLAIEVNKLSTLKTAIEAATEEYNTYSDTMIAEDTLSKDALNIAIGEVSGYITALGTYSQESLNIVFDYDVTATLTELYDMLADLALAADYRSMVSAQYSYFVETVYSAVADLDSEDLINQVKSYDEWYTNLKTLLTETEGALGAERAAAILNTLDSQMKSSMNEAYAALYARVEAQINTAYEILVTLTDVSFDNLDDYKLLKKSVGLIDKATYEFLNATANFEVPAEIVEKYNSFETALNKLSDFIATGGFDKFETVTVPDLVRPVSAAELARNDEYVADDAKVLEVIKVLDDLLTSNEFETLTGTSIKGALSQLGGLVYTDSFLNTLIQFIYPLVAQEFVKVWATLPESVKADNPIGDGQLDVKLTLYTVEEAMKSIKFYIFPAILGEQIEGDYPEVAQKLKSVTAGATLDNNPWKDAAICDEEGNLDLPWGITDKESFIAAATAGLKGLEPLLLALLANKEITDESAVGNGKVGTGKTSVKVIISVSVNVDPITLYLNVSGNSGYNNAIVPILEALGLPAEFIPDGNTFESTEDVVRTGIIDPITKLLELVAESPVDFVTKALPNLCYALEMEMIPSILSMLKTSISYHADAHYSAVGIVSGDIKNALVSDKPIDIDIGQMLDLGSLGLDLTSVNGLLSMVEGLIEGLELPYIDSLKIASLGELTLRETKRNDKIYEFGGDKAAFIEANQADVLIEVLRYVIGAVANDPTLIETIVKAIGGGEATLPGIVNDLIANIVSNPDSAMAAVVELVIPQEYATANSIAWANVEKNTVSYNNPAWCKEKAQFVADNISTFIDDIIILLGVKADGKLTDNLPELISALMKDIYNADMLNDLAGKIAGTLDGVLPEFISDILVNQLGVDFSYWNDWSCSFETGDSEAFVDALVSLFKPFDTVLGFLLLDEDLEITISDENGNSHLISALGHDGYSFGIVPLLEALGVKNLPSYAALKADRANLLKNILTPVAQRLDEIGNDPYNSVADVVANVLYFAASDGIEVSVDNILHAAYVLLDTIKPVYDLDLSSLIGYDLNDLSGDTISSFVFAKVAEALKDTTGIDLMFDFTAGSLASELAFNNVVTFTSANGTQAKRIDTTKTDYADTVTSLLRYVLKLLVFSDNSQQIADLCRDKFGLDESQYAFLSAVMSMFAGLSEDHIDYTLGVLFWIFYGADNVADAVATYYLRYARYDWKELIAKMNDSDISYIEKGAYLMTNVYKTTFVPLYDDLAEALNLKNSSEDVSNVIRSLRNLIAVIKKFFEGFADFFKSVQQ